MGCHGDSIANPIINSPYEAPQRHFEVGTFKPTGMIVKGRRASESFIPIAQIRRLDDNLLVAMGNRYANASVKGSANESNRLGR